MQSAGEPNPSEYQVSVRRLVEFILRTGDLGVGSRVPMRLLAQEGSRAHRKLQKTRPDTYEAEVALTHQVDIEEIRLKIAGRIDGVWKREEGILLEEIKSVTSAWDYEADPLHWAQIKIYGWIFCEQNTLEEIELQLTYCHLETEQVTVLREKCSRSDLAKFATNVVTEYLGWILDYHYWIQRRNRSIEALQFPHAQFRKGQRNFCRTVYKVVTNNRCLFVEAPTGTGKTISVLFPTIKSLPKKTIDRIFFLTAKNTTQQLAESALSDMARAGLHFRSITLSAKEKVCATNGKPCDVLDCPLAKGYFDRRKPAILEALQRQQLRRDEIEDVARRHQVCPHELSLDISEWVDAIICDYNYVFDPRAQLKRHFADESAKTVFLIDEAHNLVDRAREMFSAELFLSQFTAAREETNSSALSKRIAVVERAFKQLSRAGEAVEVFEEAPKEFLQTVENFIDAAEKSFAENFGRALPEPMLECYFNALSFLQIAEQFDVRYRAILETSSTEVRVRLFCLDPAPTLAGLLERAESAIFFSATLTPLAHFRAALGGNNQDQVLKLPTPFPPENLEVIVAAQIQTSFRQRAASIEEVSQALAAFVQGKAGNYLIFFPSYAYLNEVSPRVQALCLEAEFIVQTSSMGQSARDVFLSAFVAQSKKTLVAFAVMGGIFGEGIDLVGDRLIGVAVVGLGLPQLCLERNLIRNYFDQQGMDGFDHAYLFPGLNRVFQAAGRLIRSEQDRGVVLLVDSRFAEARVTDLFPPGWNQKTFRTEPELKRILEAFW